ncbi:MAG: aspartate aminotransferase family protein, partial [Actinomycetota bacterium]|nr:aspartate aminotransferase family protein [Actinomycetota bacterium]
MPDPLELKTEAEAALAYAERHARQYLADLDDAPVLETTEVAVPGELPEDGDGALAALAELVERGFPAATRSSGPRFFHFVTGGA